MWRLLLCFSLLFRGGYSKEIEIINGEKNVDIFSQNYPHLYPPNVEKEWHLTHEYGRWLITIMDMRLEDSRDCVNDYLELSEDVDLSPKKYCGSKTNVQIVTNGPNAKLRFHTDETNHDRGFRLRVERLMDDEEKVRKSRQNAASATVLHNNVEPWVLPALLASVGCAFIVFSGLIIFMIYEMRRKRLERRSRNFNNPVINWPPRQRTDSKTYGRQKSNSSTAPLTNERFMY